MNIKQILINWWAKMTGPPPPPAEDFPASYSSESPQPQSAPSQSSVFANLAKLKLLMQAPPDSSLDVRYLQMKEYLGLGECHETVRQERWYPQLSCPYCASTEIKRLSLQKASVASYYRYQCLVCQAEFGDDSESPLERGAPPIQVWMQCWYLMGLSASVNYISSQLNLDRAMVEQMIYQLQTMFNALQPFSKTSENKLELGGTHLNFLRRTAKDDIQLRDERLNADVTTAPKDTAEHRRQQQKRRDPKNTKPPGSKL